MDRAALAVLCLISGCVVRPLPEGDVESDTDDTDASSSTADVTSDDAGSTSGPPGTADSGGTLDSTATDPTIPSGTASVPSTSADDSGTDSSATSHGTDSDPSHGSVTSFTTDDTSTSLTTHGTTVTTDITATTTDITTGDTSGGHESSGESSSSSGGDEDSCFTLSWSAAVGDVGFVARVAARGDGPIFALGSVDDSTAWVGAWDQSGIALWSDTFDPSDFGLDTDGVQLNSMIAATDIDVLQGGDVLLSFQDIVVPTAAVFARLDAATGAIVWSTALTETELAVLESMYAIYEPHAYGAAVTASGRTFILGLAPSDFYSIVYTGELDPDSGSVQWLARTDLIETIFGVNYYRSRDFAAHDEGGLYRADYAEYWGDAFGGTMQRISLAGELEMTLEPEGGIGLAHRIAVGDTGEVALGWTWMSGYESVATWIPYLERRDTDLNMIAGGLDASPQLGGPMAFMSGGELVVGTCALTRLDADLNVLSVDDIAPCVGGIAPLPGGALAIGGGNAEEGHAVVERYDGCEP